MLVHKLVFQRSDCRAIDGRYLQKLETGHEDHQPVQSLATKAEEGIFRPFRHLGLLA